MDAPNSAEGEGDRMDDDAAGQDAAAAEQTTANIKQEDSGPLGTHNFTGQEFHRLQSSFQLIDISDPVALPFINASGPSDLLDSPHPETGWYTADALERIKSVVGQRFRHLVEFGVPKDEEETRDEVRRNDDRRANQRERAKMRERALLELDREEEQAAGQQGGEEHGNSPASRASPSAALRERTPGSPETQRRMSPASSGRGSPPAPARRGGRRGAAAGGAKGRKGGKADATIPGVPASSTNTEADTGAEAGPSGSPAPVTDAEDGLAAFEARQNEVEVSTVAAAVARADAEAAAAAARAGPAAKRRRGAAKKK